MVSEDLQAVRLACASARLRAFNADEGSTERVAAWAEIRQLEQQAAALTASTTVRSSSCGACAGSCYSDAGSRCVLCFGRGIVEREVRAAAL